MSDAYEEMKLKQVRYFNGHLWYRLDKKEALCIGGSNKLLKSDGTYKEFLVYESTTTRIFYKWEFFDEFFDGNEPSVEELFELLSHIRFRIFRKIKLKM